MINVYFKENLVPQILAVDDSSSNLDIVLEVLENFNVIDITDPSEVFKIVQETKIDIILLDIMMPKINGFDICKQLKSNPYTKDIPVIFITSKTDEESIEKAFEVGGIDYVTKPFKTKELLSRVHTHLELSKQKFLLQELIENQSKILQQQSKLAIMGKMIDTVMNKINSSQTLIKPVELTDLEEALDKISLELMNQTKKIIRLDKKYSYNSSNNVLICDNKIVELTHKESILLQLFISKINKTISIEDIMANVWEDSYTQEVSKESVKSQVSKLRKKLPQNCIENVYGIGYTLKL